MRVIRRFPMLAGAVSVAVVLFVLACSRLHFMRPAHPYESGQRGAGPSVLIATQGSAYKDAVSRALVSQLATRPAHVKVIDVSQLPPVLEREWDAVVLMFSWERRKPEAHARTFVERCSDRDKLVVLTTSGGGDEHLPLVDTVTSASELQRTDADAAELARRVEVVLARDKAQRDPEPSSR